MHEDVLMARGLLQIQQEITELILLGKDKTALDLLTKLERDVSSDEDLLWIQLKKHEVMVNSGLPKDGAQKIREFIDVNQSKFTKKMTVEALLLLLQLSLKIQEFEGLEELIANLETCLKELPTEIDDVRWITEKQCLSCLYKASWKMMTGNFNESDQLLASAEQLASDLENTPLLLKVRRTWGKSLFLQRKISDALLVLNQLLPRIQEYGYSRDLAEIHRELSVMYQQEGELSRAQEHLIFARDVLEHEPNPYLLMKILNSLGNLHYIKGDYSKALTNYLESLSLTVHFQDVQSRVFILSNIGSTHLMLADLESAQKYYETVRDEVLKHYGEEYFDPMDLGLVYYYQGKLQDARDCFQVSLAKLKTVHNRSRIANTLFYLIFLECDDNNMETAKTYLTELEQLVADDESLLTAGFVEIARCRVLLKQAPRKNKGSVKRTLELIVANELMAHEVRVIASFILGELLIEDHADNPNTSSREAIISWLSRLERVALEMNNQLLWVDFLVLKSKFQAIMGKYDESLETLEDARSLSIQKGYERHLKKIESEMKQIGKLKFFKQALENIGSSSSMKEREIAEKMKHEEQLLLQKLDSYLNDLIVGSTRYFSLK